MKCFFLLFALLPCGLAVAQNAIISPVLSPDGKRVAFARQTAKGSRLFVGAWNGKSVLNARSLSPAPNGDDLSPAWRPDGGLIAFASSRGPSKRFDLWTVRPDGTGLKRLTNTPKLDESAPRWSPRRFSLRQGEGTSMVPDRSRAKFSGSELRLLQRLAGSANALEKYAENAYRPTFGTPVAKRFYKLLACQSVGDTDSKIITLRDDGSDLRALEPAMPGFYSQPQFDSTGRSMAFLRSYSDAGTLKTALYFAEFPLAGEVLDNKGNSKGFGFDFPAWRKSIRRLADASPNSHINWSPNGEHIALEANANIRFIPRPDSLLAKSPSISAARLSDAGLSETGLFWAHSGKSVFLPTAQGGFVSVKNPDALADVANLVGFSAVYAGDDALDARDRPLLSRNSFVVGGRGHKQMFALYEQTDYSDLPVFVSSDSLLHLNHLVFDSLLRETETKNLLPATVELTRHYLLASIAQATSGPANLRADAQANAAYWSVVARLLRGEVATGLGSGGSAEVVANRAKNIKAMNALTLPLEAALRAVPAGAKKLADAEIALVRKHEGRASSPIFGGNLSGVGQPGAPLVDTRIDYSQLSPRGHYTRTEALRRYFLASRFLSGAPFRQTPAHLRRALLMVSATDAKAQGKLQTLSRISAQFVGQADDRRFLDFLSIARGVYGARVPFAGLGNAAKFQAFGEQVARLPGPRIAPSGGPAMTLYPAPYTLDAEVMQNLVYDRRAPDVGTEVAPRYFALGLDVMGVLGSDRARNLLDTFTFGGGFFDFGLKESGYANYDQQFRIERAKMEALPASEWKRSFYAQTLWSLKPLLNNQSNPRYKFTQNGAWTDKQLNAALGAWAELKHDTLPKQPVAIEAGGEGGLTEFLLEEQPQGFVEPSPGVFRRLRELVTAERVALAGAGFLSKESDERLSAFGALLDMVMRLETKQRTGQKFTPGEVEQLRFYGTFLEHLTLISSEGQAQTMEDSDMAIIADVSSALSTRTNELRALEEGVGRALPIYVAFERDGRRQMARGAAYSYYEFTHPASERLTDSAWQALLDTPQAPKMPEWTKSFVSRVNAPQ